MVAGFQYEEKADFDFLQAASELGDLFEGEGFRISSHHCLTANCAPLDQSQDAGLKALVYNTLGDCFNVKGLKKDAMWAYLWVDVVYNQDKIEHAKAVERLSRVFKDLNDDARADRYKDKLKSMR